jgi:hypothetical protein
LYACKVGLHNGFNLIPAWFNPLSLLTAYNYLYKSQSESSEPIIVFIGLQAVDITHLDDYKARPAGPARSLDPFADLVVDPLEVLKLCGRQKKRREAGDSKGSIKQLSKLQTCKVCNEPGYNKATYKRLIQLEGESIRLGVI